MAEPARKRKRPSAPITIYRGDEDDDDEDEDEAGGNRDLTFTRRHGHLGQSTSAIPAENPVHQQESYPDSFSWFYDDANLDIPVSDDVPTTTQAEDNSEQKVCRVH
jgi:hypothetical protein